MTQFKITGMSCAACVSRVEKAVSKVPGVTSCSVSLLTNSMGVEGEAEEQDIIHAVEEAGYHALTKENDRKNNIAKSNMNEDKLEDQETARLRKRLFYSIILLVILMYFSMGHSMFGWKIPSLLEKNAVALGILELLLSSVIMVINQRFFISGWKAAIHFAPNMDTLVALGSMVSFLYSVWTLFSMTFVQMTDGILAANFYKHGFYFESAAMIVTLISVGKTLEARSKGKTTDALKSLIQLAPKNATVVRDGMTKVIPIEQMKIDDIFLVKPGESIPVDGQIIEGESAVNEAALTGESIPVDKTPGDEVSAATINQSGYLKCKATRVGKDTTFSQIIKMVNDAAATKAPIAKTADRVAGVFVPFVLGISAITFIIWLLVGETLGNALSFAIAVLVISCPCSLGLATPVAIMVGNGMGAKHGILYKTAASLEMAGKIDFVAFDKTGTITKGEPQVTDLYPASGISEEQLLSVAYALEDKSEHPLAKAVVEKAKQDGIEVKQTKESRAIAGKGILAKFSDNEWIYGGNKTWIKEKTVLSDEFETLSTALSKEGKTPLFFAKNDTFLGLIAVADVIKEDAKKAISELKNMGIHVVMLTGDNEQTAQAIAKQAGVDEVVSEVLPKDKEEVIQTLQTLGTVAMAGDGINDAPALTRADLGIAIGSGTDVAIDAADIVLMKSRLRDVPAAIRLGRATVKNIHENLFWAFFYNALGIPVAAGVLASSFGIRLNPMIGAAAMSLSSVCVVTNALRLNHFKIYDAKKDKMRKKAAMSIDLLKQKEKKTNTEEKTMQKIITIKGMMCPHCEARVKETLEAMPEVKEAIVSFESGTAVVTFNETVADDILKDAIEKEKYEVKDIKKVL